MSSVLHHRDSETMYIAELYIMTLEQTQHDLGMTLYNVVILCKGSPHDVETSI